MIRSLQTRLALGLFVGFLLMAVVTAVFFVRAMQWHQKEVVQALHKDLAQVVVDQYLYWGDDTLDLETTKKLFHDLMILGPNLEFYLVSPKGEVLAYSTEPSKIKRKTISLAPIEQYLTQAGRSGVLVGEDPKSESLSKIFTVAPIKRQGRELGYLYVILSSVKFEALQDSLIAHNFFEWGLWVIGVGFVGGFLALLFFMLFVTRPIKSLSRFVRRARTEGFEGQIDATVARLEKAAKGQSITEVHDLVEAFLALIKILNDKHQQVLDLDASRRELIAHVSHDLRSPLASLQGYLETWELNKDALSLEDAAKYIGIAKANAVKLSRLVDQLFELAQLESQTESLQIEELSIAELIHDVLKKFELQAKAKQVNLSVNPRDSSFLVKADVEKLERVITNLVDNALRHTQEGGFVRVNLSNTTAGVQVTVSDSGSGIDPEDLPLIFEPHYKVAANVRSNIAQGGLGLTITKKLLALHKVAIEATSEPGKGACFQFQLPASRAA